MSLGVGVPALLVGLFGDGYLHIKHAQADRYTLLFAFYSEVYFITKYSILFYIWVFVR